MPRRSKGARLYLRERKGREPVYVILHGTREIGTGFGAHESERANKVLGEYLETHFRPDTGKRDLAKITVAEVLMLYGQDIAPTKASAATIGYHMKALLPFWGEKTLADVKGSTCRQYLKHRTMDSAAGSYPTRRLAGSVKSSTVRRELKTLQAAINHWHRESPLAAVPKVTLPEEGARRERVLERNEVAAMIRAARRLKLNHVARFILIGVYTGTRHDAILRLRWSAALHGGHIDIAHGVIFRKGIADRETSKRRPPVRVSGTRLGAHLARWQRQDQSCSASHVIQYGGQPITKLRRSWAHVVKEAGLGWMVKLPDGREKFETDVTPHVLRHTCASWNLWEGKTIWDVAGVIGADATTVQKVYGHHRLEIEQRKRA